MTRVNFSLHHEEMHHRLWPLDSGDDAQPVTRTRKRKPSLTSVMRQAAKAGVEIAAYEVRPDGTVNIIVGKPIVGGDMDGTTSSDPKWN
jgi:hypothetical protein